MTILRFSIIGSAEAERNEPTHPFHFDPLVNIKETREAAKLLGAEIAKRGHGLVVYDSRYIEADVVEGFVAANPKANDAEAPIIIYQPPTEKLQQFKEELTHGALFERRADKTGHWEVSFYRSLADSDGVILLGGANSTMIAGQVSIGARVPILALERTGGAAGVVWKTIVPGIDLPTIDEHARMAHAPTADTASVWVKALEAQRRRRFAVETGPILWHAVYASLLFVLALAAALGSHLIPGIVTAFAKTLLLAATLLAGAAGASIRMVFERRYGSGPLVPPSMAITFALGAMAGALAGLLYLIAQPSDVELSKEPGLRLAAIVAVVSTIGGLTAETIFRKLLGIDVLQTRSIVASGGTTAESGK
jgi:hypothetical protein